MLLLSLISFSQTVTNNKICEVRIPCTTANKIVVDLLRGDSAMAELKVTQQVLNNTNLIVKQQGEILKAFEIKEENYKHQISLYEQKETQYKEIVLGLEKDNSKYKKQIKRLKIGAISLGAGFIISLLVQ